MEEEDLPGALALLKRVDPAMYADLGSLDRLAHLEPMHGAGAGWVMPAYTWGGPGRFNGTTFSAFYAAETIETAIAETVYHQARALRDERADPIDIRMRALRADIHASDFVDLTGVPASDPLYHPTDYTASQAFGAEARAAGRNGILFASVRRPRHPCMAVLQPSQVRRCEDAGTYVYRWDGAQITVEQRTRITW
ncbi:MAG TPA: RES family NAD+ phosphorylase [Longimicrobiaceae bacterium]|nr:RES family NAD+ phosphorylase [Longimicrobiaceae bacterium]